LVRRSGWAQLELIQASAVDARSRVRPSRLLIPRCQKLAAGISPLSWPPAASVEECYPATSRIRTGLADIASQEVASRSQKTTMPISG
jgi:hypothetical protein